MSKYLVTLCVLSLALICAPALQGQALKPGIRPPVTVDLKDDKATVKPGTKPPVTVDFEKVVVIGIQPNSYVKLPSDGTTVEKRRIIGHNLNRSLTVKVFKGNMPTGAITATLKPPKKSGKMGLWLTAKPTAPAGKDYKVRLTDGTRMIDLPLTVEVLPKQLGSSAGSLVPSVNLGGGKPALDPAAKDRLLKGTKGGQLKTPPPVGVKFTEKKGLVEGAAEGAPRVNLEHLASKGVIDFPDATLQVKRSDAIDAWGNYWADRPAVKNKFRWMTSLDDLIYFRWEVADNADFKNIIATGQSVAVAEPGRYGYFDIDFAPIAGSRPPPLHYFVRVVPVQRKEGSSSATAGVDADPSNYVHVTIMTPGEVTQFSEPVIQVLMPGYGCRPGGTFRLRGFNFGNEPGIIRLVGNFPGGEVVLDNLEWTSTLVSGKVPMIRGVMDQEVSIQVETLGGWQSNTDFTCSFKPTREKKLLADGYWVLVDPGNNVKIGDYFKRVDPGHGNIIVQHRVDHNFGYLGSVGVDKVIMTAPLINGWRFTGMSWSEFNDAGGTIHSVTGFDKNAKQLTIEVHWETERVGIVHWSMSIEVEGPAGIPMFHWQDLEDMEEE